MKLSTSYKTSQFAQIGERLSNPFPGLRPFGIDEAHLFFGREGQSDEILLKLAQNRFAAVLGFSGSGKSSLIYCGLIPILHGGFMTEAGADWRIIVMRPGTNPIDNLAEALVAGSEEYESISTEQQVIRKTVLATILRSSSLGLIEAVKHLRADTKENILVLVDQFEEIFRYKKLETKVAGIDESSLFVALLVEAVRRQQEPIYVALTMRSDFIGECATFPELTQMINDSHYLIPQMNREHKRMAIEGPVAVGGGKVAPRLAQQLLNDVGESPDQLPILQHALMRTWQHWRANHRKDELIDLQHYNAIGTLKEALSQHANEAYDSLNKREQRICEVMFKALTEHGAEGKMIRRPTKLGIMASIAGVSEEDMARVVERFREPGRTLLMPPHEVVIDSDTVVDISHESLMRIWTRLKTWVEEESRSAEMYLKLSEASERYQKGAAGLWAMPDLQLALNWKEETKPTLLWGRRYHPAFERTMVFLETSRRSYQNDQQNKERLQRRKIRIRNIIAVVFAFIAVAFVFLTYLSLTKAAEAEASAKQARTAEEDAKKALEDAKIAEADAKRQRDKARSATDQAQKALTEAQQARDQAQRAEKDALEQKVIAEEQKLAAEKAEKKAAAARDQAVAEKEEADRQRQLAITAQERADRLRYQAIAQSMAVKVEDQRDQQQKTLMAMQAYLFYDEYGEKLYNADIYEGVYNAYKANAGDDANHYSVHEGTVRAVTFANKADMVYSSSSDGKVYRWTLASTEKTPTLIYDMSDKNMVFRVLVPIAGGSRLVTTGEASTYSSRRIHIIDARNGGAIKILTAPTQFVYDLAVTSDEKEFISVGRDRRIYRGSLTTDGEYSAIGRSEALVHKISLSPDDKTLATVDASGKVILWDIRTGKKRVIYQASTSMHAVCFSHSGKFLALGDASGEIILWDMEKNVPYTDLSAHSTQVQDIRFSMDDRLMASAGWDKTVKVWDIENINDLPIVLKDHSDWVWNVAFSHDGKQLATASSDQLLRVYPTQAGDMISILCPNASRNMSKKEWIRFVAEDIDYRITCEEYLKGE